MLNRFNKLFFETAFFIAISFMISCNQIDVFEKSTSIPDHNWNYDFKCTGSFNISDTNAYYNVYIVVRHTDAYKYNNIWLNLGLQMPGDTLNTQKVNLTLGDDANGWYGSGLDDIWEVRKKLSKYPKQFKKQGTYSYKLSHIMRDNPLNHVMSAGIRIEKVH